MLEFDKMHVTNLQTIKIIYIYGIVFDVLIWRPKLRQFVQANMILPIVHSTKLYMKAQLPTKVSTALLKSLNILITGLMTQNALVVWIIWSYVQESQIELAFRKFTRISHRLIRN